MEIVCKSCKNSLIIETISEMSIKHDQTTEVIFCLLLKKAVPFPTVKCSRVNKELNGPESED